MKKIDTIKDKLFFFFKKYRWIIIIVLSLFIFIDYYDLGILVGWGIFNKHASPNPIEPIVAFLLLLTLYETIKTGKEAVRQTELTLRPYMRLSWNTDQIGDNRRAQGITDTCIVVSNNGRGLMRSVKYNVLIDGKKVDVRNHAVIVSNDNTNMVYDDDTNQAGVALGCRNDRDFEKKNNEIIRKNKIQISGTYRDMEGGKYQFSFESDPSEQSWFAEKYRQELINR